MSKRDVRNGDHDPRLKTLPVCVSMAEWPAWMWRIRNE